MLYMKHIYIIYIVLSLKYRKTDVILSDGEIYLYSEGKLLLQLNTVGLLSGTHYTSALNRKSNLNNLIINTTTNNKQES